MPETSKKKCPDCGSTKHIYDEQKGEVICRNCGLVLEDKMIDMGQEWRQFEDGDKKGRGGSPLSMQKFDQGLTTNVGEISDIYQLGSEKKIKKYFRLKKWQERVSTSIERNLRLAMTELRRVASFLSLPNFVKEEASRIYNLVLQRGLVRGRSMESVVSACIYASCRSYNIPRTLDEISAASDVERKEIGRTYRFIIRKLDFKITPSNPKDYIARFSSTLHLTPKAQNDAIKILKKAELSELTSGRGPAGIAAAALYLAALLNEEKKTQREVADVAGVTEVTIRNRYKELLDKLDMEEKLKIKEAESRAEKDQKIALKSGKTKPEKAKSEKTKSKKK
ncbi:transcription initiation factor IIB [Candidatus Pacearchaeota archaeon]|nr:transcription initiation factor IIB [Candidatus Pacearchaeota archaeon]